MLETSSSGAECPPKVATEEVLVGGLSSPLSTPIPWHTAMIYERAEVVSLLQHWVNMKCCRTDCIGIKEVYRHCCSTGLGSQTEHVLCITGTASRCREALYLKLVRFMRQTTISDLELQVRFGSYAGDPMPGRLMVQPLHDSAQFRAMRYWNHAFWAMRSGIVKKIWDTRAMTQQRIHASGAGTSTSAAKRQAVMYQGGAKMNKPSNADDVEHDEAEHRGEEAMHAATSPRNGTRSKSSPHMGRKKRLPFVPMQVYHTECASLSLDVTRLMLNAPSLVVVWASWDHASVEWLQESLFARHHRNPTSTNSKGDDPWIACLRRYVFVPEPTTWETVLATHGTHKRKGGGHVPVVGDASHAAAAGGDAAGASPTSSSSLCKRGNIILVSVDSDRDAAANVMSDLLRRSHFWKSPDVSFSSVWVGPQGMQSDFAVQLDICVLPTVFGCDMPTSAGTLPLIRTVDDGRRATATATASLSGTTDVPPSAMLSTPIGTGPASTSRLGLPMWHDVDSALRTKILQRISEVVSSNDAPLVLESSLEVIYPSYIHDEKVQYKTESDLTNHGVKKSTLRFHGSCCTAAVVNPLHEELEHLTLRVRNADVRLLTFPPSSGITFQFDALTAEHRVKGMYRNVTCTQCRRYIRTECEPHYRCLHCPPTASVVCVECYEHRLHPLYHIAVKIRSDTTLVSSSAPIWGSSNVVMLPTMQGHVVPSLSNVHHDAFCNGCKTLIHGERWRCCFCHEYDLCAACESLWWSHIGGSASSVSPRKRSVAGKPTPSIGNTKRGSVASGSTNTNHTSTLALARSIADHPLSHYMMHIRCAVAGDANCFLQPTMTSITTTVV